MQSARSTARSRLAMAPPSRCTTLCIRRGGSIVDMVVRGLVIYAVVLLVFRIAGERTLSDITTFDFVLLLIVAEAVQQGLVGDDFSVTNGFVLLVVLMGTDI